MQALTQGIIQINQTFLSLTQELASLSLVNLDWQYFIKMQCKVIIYFVSLLFIISSCQTQEKRHPAKEVTDKVGLDFAEISAKIVEQANLLPEEKVLLVMAPGDFNPIISLLQKAITNAGAEYLGTISVTEDQPEEWSTTFTNRTNGQPIRELEKVLSEVDLGIMLPGATPDHPPYKALQNILQHDTRRTIHFHWAGAYDLNGHELDIDSLKSSFYQEVILNTDYQALAERQLAFENAMRGQIIHVTTPAGTDLTFQIGNRPVTKQDGNASAARAQMGQNLIDREIEIPSGAIRVAPMEESVQGKIAFPDAQWNGSPVEGLMVTIENGVIIDVAATSGQDAVEKEMENAGVAGKSFREFALGFNPLMPIQTDAESWIPYYGYGAGVVRLSLGDNIELGGKVGGGYVRWNFFTDATVLVGDSTWVRDGKLVR